MTVYVVMRYCEDVIDTLCWFQDEASAKSYVQDQPRPEPFYSSYFYTAVEEKV